jgi:hypothetical protein
MIPVDRAERLYSFRQGVIYIHHIYSGVLLQDTTIDTSTSNSDASSSFVSAEVAITLECLSEVSPTRLISAGMPFRNALSEWPRRASCR